VLEQIANKMELEIFLTAQNYSKKQSFRKGNELEVIKMCKAIRT
jgi:hypothetical protein